MPCNPTDGGLKTTEGQNDWAGGFVYIRHHRSGVDEFFSLSDSN